MKEEIYQACQNQLNQRIERLQKAMNDAQEASNSETKSSAGDKYETGRAMMHLEKQKYAQQLAASLQLRQTLDQVNPESKHDTVQFGSLVYTNNGTFFIAVSLGKIKLNQEIYLAISLSSPIGKSLRHKKQGEQIAFGNRTFIINEIA